MHKPPHAPKSPHWWWVWVASVVAWPPITALLMTSSGDQFIRGIIWFVTGLLCLVGGVFSSFALAQRVLSRHARPHPDAVFGLALLFMLGGLLLFAATFFAACVVMFNSGAIDFF